jgi:hypothetical protein
MSAYLSSLQIFPLSRECYLQARRIWDRVRRSMKRNRKFRRASNVERRQRWFLSPDDACRMLKWMNCEPIFS